MSWRLRVAVAGDWVVFCWSSQRTTAKRACLTASENSHSLPSHQIQRPRTSLVEQHVNTTVGARVRHGQARCSDKRCYDRRNCIRRQRVIPSKLGVYLVEKAFVHLRAGAEVVDDGGVRAGERVCGLKCECLCVGGWPFECAQVGVLGEQESVQIA